MEPIESSRGESGTLQRRILIGITGASGAVYAQRLVEILCERVARVYIVATAAGREVVRHELGAGKENQEEKINIGAILNGTVPTSLRQVIRVFKEDDLFAPVASGSSVPDAMIVIPCSMGSLARMATGVSSNLLERAADVVLKQRKRLVIVPRETPLSSIHLRNMLTLSDAGAIIVPPMPAFYQQPKSVADIVDFVVGRVLEVLDLPHDLYDPWNKRMR